MFSVSASGSFKNTESFLKKTSRLDIRQAMDRAAQEGVAALSSVTPKDSGLSASSWSYKITRSKRGVTITWYNTDLETGFPVAVMLQYGYATGTGGYVAGRDYINPAIRPIFNKISDDVWRMVTNA